MNLTAAAAAAAAAAANRLGRTSACSRFDGEGSPAVDAPSDLPNLGARVVGLPLNEMLDDAPGAWSSAAVFTVGYC